MGLSFSLLWTYITHHRHLLGVELTDLQIRMTTTRFVIGSPVYAIAVAVAFISPAVVLVIIALLALYYAIAGMRSPLAVKDPEP